MQAETVYRLAGNLGIVCSPHCPLTTLLVPLVETVLDGGALCSYASDGDRAEDVQEFRALVNAIADDYLPENRPCPKDRLDG